MQNAVGSCGGVRSCGPAGLSACSGKVPAVESCNGQDDDCNGQTDEGPLCDDGNPCTVGDVCQVGACKPGVAKSCDDQNDCTDDACAKANGKCTYAPSDDVACSDGNPCTQGEKCATGVCLGGVAQPCPCASNSDCATQEDGDQCNGTLYCDPKTSKCSVNPSTVVVCPSTSNTCTSSGCVPKTGQCEVANLPDTTTCSDGLAWTEGDNCQGGKCAAGVATKLCGSTADCAKYEDGDVCNGTLFCNKATGVCQLNPATVVYCATADDTPCRKNPCGAKMGTCELTPINELKPCEDGNLCTSGEACKMGVCTAAVGADTCICKSDGDCAKFEDGDLCNGTLFCNLASQKCAVNPKSVVVCPTGGDGPCAKTTCAPDSGKCALVVANGTPLCDADGSPCTPLDACIAGKCVADTANVCQCQTDAQCADDDNLCNGVPYCDKAKNVCIPNPKTVVACELAGDTTCVATQCQPATGNCAKVNTTSACSDGDACTVGDVCVGGSCKAGNDTCGACKVNGDCDDKDVCTDDACAGQPKACSHNNNAAVCSDGDACTTGDACTAGKCTGKPQVCDDQEPCTSDGCQGGACVFLASNTATCTDGDACTAGDFCLNKACKSGQGKTDCDDKVACTVDSCDVFKGCQHAAGVCDDKTVCTDDVCDLTEGCVFTAKPACNDSNGCTADSCDAVKGCVYLPTAVTCSDGNACTVGDKCGAGACLPGAVTACDDGNQCTKDGCDPAKGCGFVVQADGATCSDGDTCSTGDACKAGACVSVAAPCLNAVGCPPTGAGVVCGGGLGACDAGHCFQTDPKGYKWTLVPAGKFWMGCNAVVDGDCSGYPYENPQHEVKLSAYWIGVYEVTAEVYKKCVISQVNGCTVPSTTGGNDLSTYGTTGKEQHPVNFIKWSQAQTVCTWLGGDLPTEAQWERAARGGCEVYAGKDCKASVVKYPWGNEEPVCGTHAVFSSGGHGCGTGSTYAVGAGSPKGASPYGAYDMAANVWEWTMDWYLGIFYSKAEATATDAWNSTADLFRAYRGGSLEYGAPQVRSSNRSLGGTTLAGAGLGVRCAKPVLETVCDNKDDNGNGQTDEGCDDDKDGYCEVAMAVAGTPTACPKGTNDCDDGKAGVNPGASEACGNGVDDNCAVGVDEGCATAGMVLIPAGTFWMGCNATKDTDCSANANESPQHKVTLSAYYMDITEVTVAEYKKCFEAGKCGEPGGAGSGYCNWDTAAKKAKSGREQHPVNCVNWAESQKYCKWRGGQVDAANASKYDLPTEAQWEMAARGSCEKNGSTAGNDAGCTAAMRTYPWGEQTATCTYAVMNSGDIGCGANATSAVGGKSAGDSPYGLKDMAGNVYEWTRDWYSATYYASSPATDPENTVSATYRVIRGGSFYFFASEVRAGYRYGPIPTGIEHLIGLRCSRSYP